MSNDVSDMSIKVAEKKSLIELLNEASELCKALADNGGELNEDLERRLALNGNMLPQKVDAYYTVLSRLNNDAEYFQSQANELYEIAKTYTLAHARLRDRLKAIIEQSGSDSLKGHVYSFKVSKRAPRLVIDEAKLDRAYIMPVIKTEVDKERIKQDLLAGKPVEGASLEPVLALTVKPTRG